VQGTGLATGTPDLLTVTLDVSVSGSSATAALSQDNQTTGAVVDALRAGGVHRPDIQTTDLNIQPDYSLEHGTSVLTGYGVTNSVVAKIRRAGFASAGTVIDQVAAAGGNPVQIGSLSFSIDDPRTLEDRARTDAVGQAVAHARSMALAAGERLGGLCAASDTTPSAGPVLGQTSAAGFATNAAASVPLEPGSQQASAQVRLVYALLPRR
jgi:uncharacterized protein YggE